MGALFMTLTLGNHPMYSDQLISTHIAHNPEDGVCFIFYSWRELWLLQV